MREPAGSHERHALGARVQDGAQGLAPGIAAGRGRLGRQIHVHVEGNDGHARLGHGEVQGHEEGVVEGEVLGIGQVEAALDPLLEDGPRERLVHVEGIAIAVELARDGGPDVDGESRNGREEEALDVIAGDHADDVGTRSLEELLDLAISGVNAEDHVPVLGLRPDEKLRGVRAGERGDQRHDPMLGHRRQNAQALRDSCAR